ncbi:MAG: UDP-N-acetylglucosamine 2-epimerase (non-hydrolyzing) [Mariniphaga sp.]|nr:UDP-N-acetylglucosamine 2-epimerase (non-hydrolyzing) [Mariniphaga sp.]
MKKILLVFGTRPEAIKMAPLVKELQKHPDIFETMVCVTGQHREMLDQVLNLFEIIPDYDLNIMKARQNLYDVTSRVLLGMRDVLTEAKPDIVLVHGDTTTSTTAALASFYQQIPVGHIEAGLRTHNIYSPWPEEMNRQITGRLTKYHFAPTPLSKQNLLAEGISEDKIHVTGNTVIDALHLVLDKIKNDNNINETITKILISLGLPLGKLNSWQNSQENTKFAKSSTSQDSIQNNDYRRSTTSKHPFVESRKLVLITGHRRENFGQGFLNICEAIKHLAKSFPEVDFVYPMHLNPNVRNAIKDVFGVTGIPNKNEESHKLSFKQSRNTYFIEPLDYLPFVYLMNLSNIILTDSGGIQEEAPSLGKPVLVMRDNSERPEAIYAETVKLVGTSIDKIVGATTKLLKDKVEYLKMINAKNPYGDGKSALVIYNILKTIYK